MRATTPARRCALQATPLQQTTTLGRTQRANSATRATCAGDGVEQCQPLQHVVKLLVPDRLLHAALCAQRAHSPDALRRKHKPKRILQIHVVDVVKVGVVARRRRRRRSLALVRRQHLVQRKQLVQQACASTVTSHNQQTTCRTAPQHRVDARVQARLEDLRSTQEIDRRLTAQRVTRRRTACSQSSHSAHVRLFGASEKQTKSTDATSQPESQLARACLRL